MERRIAELEREVRTLEALRAEAVDGLNASRVQIDRLQLLLSQRGSEYEALREQLATLRAIEEEVRDRNRIYQDMIGRFQSLIDGGRVSVNIVRGRMVIQLPQDILFGSGSATIGADGRRTLEEIGSVLAELEDREFQVEGHSDNVPISTERFPSNWELSSARALSVVRILTQAGVAPTRVSGAGFAEFQPVASNEDAAGRRRNRRIEIVMLPNLDVIAGASLPNR
jgi:chemotaxis protein MotB